MTRADIAEALQAVIREAFNAPNAVIADDTIADDIPGWDSLSHTVLIFMVEERFGVEIEPERAFADVGELIDLIAARRAA